MIPSFELDPIRISPDLSSKIFTDIAVQTSWEQLATSTSQNMTAGFTPDLSKVFDTTALFTPKSQQSVLTPESFLTPVPSAFGGNFSVPATPHPETSAAKEILNFFTSRPQSFNGFIPIVLTVAAAHPAVRVVQIGGSLMIAGYLAYINQRMAIEQLDSSHEGFPISDPDFMPYSQPLPRDVQDLGSTVTLTTQPGKGSWIYTTPPAMLALFAVHKINSASSVNAKIALNKKMSALEHAQIKAVKVETLPDGRIRYYGEEKPSKTVGATRGASYVTEHNPANGQVRSWVECYDHDGNVNRIHPKMIDGQPILGQHYPPTKAELETSSKKTGATL